MSEPRCDPNGVPGIDKVPTGKFTVLVVDDDALIAMSTSAMVEDLGHAVIEVHSGARALEVLRNGEKVDCLVTDFTMPKMNGGELIKAARALRPGLPVVLATGYAEMPTGIDVPIHRLIKPFNQDQLEAAVAKAVNGGA